jgi:steroid 5-alpha reductase family enzyme
VWAVGFLFETAADITKAIFNANPANRSSFITVWPWSWSRHPNYFGESMFWVGLGLIATAVGAPWALVSPVVITVLLLRVSGVALMEKTIGTRRPEYAAYIARTSAFVPWWPRKG